MEKNCRVEIEYESIVKSIFTGKKVFLYKITGPGKVTMQKIPHNRE
jgi:uncharacterized protein (AIM24 family)